MNFVAPKFDGYHCVGWVNSAHGIRGEIFVRLYAAVADWQDAVEELVLLPKAKSDLQFFQIKKMQPHKDGLIVSLEGIADRNAAELLAKASVYVPEEVLESEEGDPVFLKQIADFHVVDKDGVVLGQIVGFASNGPQDLLKVRTTSGKEALVPLVDAFLVHIDFDKQQVTMDLPPGLLNLDAD